MQAEATKQRRGFACGDNARRAAMMNENRHRFTSAEASEAGRKGGARPKRRLARFTVWLEAQFAR